MYHKQKLFLFHFEIMVYFVDQICYRKRDNTKGENTEQE